LTVTVEPALSCAEAAGVVKLASVAGLRCETLNEYMPVLLLISGIIRVKYLPLLVQVHNHARLPVVEDE
jgi:hypothetical protein